MRPQGHARINSKYPQARAVCDFCGFIYNHVDLQWQMEWSGPHLINKRFLVCQSCLDTPQEQLRTVVTPQDPEPIANARPEQYVNDDNPLSPLGQSPSYLTGGANIGTMQNLGFAFDANTNASFSFSAGLAVSNSSFQNTLGKNWNGDPSGVTAVTASSSLTALNTTVTHTVASFTAYAPSNSAFLVGQATGYLFQGSSNGTNWTTLSSGTTAGAIGETLSVTSVTGGAYAYHQFALQGDGVNSVGVAELQINVSDQAQPS
jgi:hypothetical protein